MTPIRSLFGRLFGTPAAAPGGELITGIVHPSGAGGSQVPPAPDWTLRFTLEEWRGEDGVIRTTPLSIHQTTGHDEMRALMDRINDTRIITARVRFDGDGSAELLGLLKGFIPAHDPLAVRSIELSQAVTRETEQFGTLRLNRALNWWEGKGAWGDDEVGINLVAGDEAGLGEALATAGALWDDQAGWSERIRAYAVEELLPLKNDSWLEDDEEPLTPAEFRARMRLDSITVDPDGSFTFWHDDGDLFWGHSIQIDGTLQDGPTGADIPG